MLNPFNKKIKNQALQGVQSSKIIKKDGSRAKEETKNSLKVNQESIEILQTKLKQRNDAREKASVKLGKLLGQENTDLINKIKEDIKNIQTQPGNTQSDKKLSDRDIKLLSRITELQNIVKQHDAEIKNIENKIIGYASGMSSILSPIPTTSDGSTTQANTHAPSSRPKSNNTATAGTSRNTGIPSNKLVKPKVSTTTTGTPSTASTPASSTAKGISVSPQTTLLSSNQSLSQSSEPGFIKVKLKNGDYVTELKDDGQPHSATSNSEGAKLFSYNEVKSYFTDAPAIEFNGDGRAPDCTYEEGTNSMIIKSKGAEIKFASNVTNVIPSIKVGNRTINFHDNPKEFATQYAQNYKGDLDFVVGDTKVFIKNGQISIKEKEGAETKIKGDSDEMKAIQSRMKGSISATDPQSSQNAEQSSNARISVSPQATQSQGASSDVVTLNNLTYDNDVSEEDMYETISDGSNVENEEQASSDNANQDETLDLTTTQLNDASSTSNLNLSDSDFSVSSRSLSGSSQVSSNMSRGNDTMQPMNNSNTVTQSPSASQTPSNTGSLTEDVARESKKIKSVVPKISDTKQSTIDSFKEELRAAKTGIALSQKTLQNGFDKRQIEIYFHKNKSKADFEIAKSRKNESNMQEYSEALRQLLSQKKSIIEYLEWDLNNVQRTVNNNIEKFDGKFTQYRTDARTDKGTKKALDSYNKQIKAFSTQANKCLKLYEKQISDCIAQEKRAVNFLEQKLLELKQTQVKVDGSNQSNSDKYYDAQTTLTGNEQSDQNLTLGDTTSISPTTGESEAVSSISVSADNSTAESISGQDSNDVDAPSITAISSTTESNIVPSTGERQASNNATQKLATAAASLVGVQSKTHIGSGESTIFVSTDNLTNALSSNISATTQNYQESNPIAISGRA